MANKPIVSGDWLQSGSLEEERLKSLIYARVMAVERNEYSMVILFSNGSKLTVEGAGVDGSALNIEVERDL